MLSMSVATVDANNGDVMNTQAVETAAKEIKVQLNELQVWFAARCYGWRDNATPDQLRQFEDREREQDALISRLEMLQG